MKDKVEAGLISDVKDLLKKALSSIFNLVDKVAGSIGWEAKGEAEEVTVDGRKGMKRMYEAGDSGAVTITTFPIEGDNDSFDVKFEVDAVLDGKHIKGEESHKKVKESQINDLLSKFAAKHGFEKIESSSSIRVTLQRVTCGDESTINMTAICADEFISDLMTRVDELVANDDFVSTICENPTTFAIAEDADSFDVQEQAEPINCCDVLLKLIFKQQAIINSLKTIHWGAKGDDFFTLHNRTESLYSAITWHMDTMGEYMVEKFDTIPDLNGGCYCKYVQETSTGYDVRSGFEAIRCLLEKYVCELECFYMVAEHDMQSVLDNFIRDMKREKDYFSKQILE